MDLENGIHRKKLSEESEKFLLGEIPNDRQKCLLKIITSN